MVIQIAERKINPYEILELHSKNGDIKTAFMNLIKSSKPKPIKYIFQKDQKIKKLEEYFKDMDKVRNLLTLMGLEKSILNIYESLNKRIEKLKQIDNEEESLKLYEDTITIINSNFKLIEEKYRCIAMISKDFEKDNINYDCSIKELFNQLESLTHRYILAEIRKVKDLVNKSILKYKNYEYYNELKSFITNIANDYTNKIIKNITKSSELILQMQNLIESYFAKYQKNLKKVNSLDKDAEFIELVKILKQNLLSANFEPLYQAVCQKIDIKKNAKRYNEKKDYLENLYQDLKNKISHSLAINKDRYYFQYLKQLENYISKIYNKAQKGLINIELLDLIKNISLKNPLADLKILQAIESNISFIPQNNIYINGTQNNPYFATLNYLNGEFVMNHFTNQEIVSEPVKLEEISSKFMLLEELISKGDYIGKRFAKDLIILYIYKGYILYLDSEGRINITKSYFDIKTNGSVNEIFKNKKYLLSVISNQLNQDYDINNNYYKK